MLKKVNRDALIQNQIVDTKSLTITLPSNKIILSRLILKDMMYYINIWRLIRGYSSYGHRSHSNNKSNKKNKIINNFRLQQFYILFGRKKRDIFSILILAEYNNRLWFIMWNSEWAHGTIFLLRLLQKSKGKVKFDPNLLSKNIITGLQKKKKKKKT